MSDYQIALRDSHGRIVYCMHAGCTRPAVRIVAWEAPRHRQFRGQTHDCCSTHSHAVSR